MKLYTFQHMTGPRSAVVLDNKSSLDLTDAFPDLPGDLPGLFGHLPEVRDRIAVLMRSGLAEDSSAVFPTGSRPWLPPILRPSKIIAVGLNYKDHAAEQNKTPPTRPMFFSKAVTCLQAHNGPIALDDDLVQVDAEAELAVVIAKAGRRIPASAAEDYIAGYTCFNDVSNRDAQNTDKQFFRGKSIDTGGPCGPWIVTPDELPPLAHGLSITGTINGDVLQSSNTNQLIFPIDELIEHASRHMTLLPGDIIATGTPAGVGVYRNPPRFLQPGDLVEIRIEGIGTLVNPVISI